MANRAKAKRMVSSLFSAICVLLGMAFAWINEASKGPGLAKDGRPLLKDRTWTVTITATATTTLMAKTSQSPLRPTSRKAILFSKKTTTTPRRRPRPTWPIQEPKGIPETVGRSRPIYCEEDSQDIFVSLAKVSKGLEPVPLDYKAMFEVARELVFAKEIFHSAAIDSEIYRADKILSQTNVKMLRNVKELSKRLSGLPADPELANLCRRATETLDIMDNFTRWKSLNLNDVEFDDGVSNEVKRAEIKRQQNRLWKRYQNQLIFGYDTAQAQLKSFLKKRELMKEFKNFTKKFELLAKWNFDTLEKLSITSTRDRKQRHSLETQLACFQQYDKSVDKLSHSIEETIEGLSMVMNCKVLDHERFRAWKGTEQPIDGVAHQMAELRNPGDVFCEDRIEKTKSAVEHLERIKSQGY